MSTTIYPGVGTTCRVNNERATITGLKSTYGLDSRLLGLFARKDTGTMHYLTLGAQVSTCTCGATSLNKETHNVLCDLTQGRKGYYEVTGESEIDRDAFDRLNGIDTLRTELGWVAP